MKSLLVFSVLILLVALPATSVADAPHQQEGSITPFSYPTVRISVNQSTSFNLSLQDISLISHTENHNVVYTANLGMGKWTVHYNDHNLSYSSTLFMRPMNPVTISPPHNNHNSLGNPLTVHVVVNITRSNSAPIISTGNSTINSTLRITYYLSFNSKIPGSGQVIIGQGIAENSRFDFFNLNPQNNNMEFPHAKKGQGLIFSNKTTNNAFAAFWWNNTFELNGMEQNLSSNYTISNNRESLVLFTYNYTDGLKTLYQDPYFTIYGLDIFSYPVLKQDLYRAYNYILMNIEDLVAGMGIGAGIIGLSYASYRRRKF